MQYVAFLRGLNVGGSHTVKMAELRQLFSDCGLEAVQTYIQSGNVLFESSLEEAALPARIGDAFKARFGFPGDAVVRSAAELAALLENLPFSAGAMAQAEAADPKTTHVYVYLSNGRIDPDAALALQSAYGGEDLLVPGERELYLLCKQSVRLSRLAASLARLDASLTARNLNTLRAVAALASL